jgi:hypothetical protein
MSTGSDDEEYEYIHTLTSSIHHDDNEEEYMYYHHNRQHHEALETTAIKQHHPHNRIKTLNDAEETSQFLTYNMNMLREIQISKRYRWSFCISSVFAVLLFISCASLFSYNLFFRPPFIFIEQVQIYHLPFRDQCIGFQIIINCNNPNSASITMSSVALAMTIIDAHTGTNYNIEEPIEHNWNSTTSIINRWSSDTVSVNAYIFIGDSPNYPQILDLVARNINVQFTLQGKITSKIGAFYHTQSLSKNQLYYVESNKNF